MRASLLLLPVSAALLIIAACQPAAAPQPDAAARAATDTAATGHSIRYRCDGVPVQATFDGEDAASVVVGGVTHAMKVLPSASGARYGDEQGNVFWTRGSDQALLALKDQPERQCVAGPAPAAAPQAAATVAAGDAAADAAAQAFRATGNEPGWLAEVGVGGTGLRVEVDYGQTRYEVAAPSAGPDGWAGAAADGTPVKLSIQRVPCQDDMSGRAFEAKAMLTVGTRQLHGCGAFVTRP